MTRKENPHHPIKPILFALALALIVSGGALLRFSNADWDGGNQFHPDERGILYIAQTIDAPSSLREFFQPRSSPLNPYRDENGNRRAYAYGHLPLYANVFTGRLLNAAGQQIADHGTAINPASFWGHLLNLEDAPPFIHLTYTGRALSALFDTLTILAAGLLACRLFDEWAGLLAAAVTALAVLHIQNAHFGTVDSALALFATLTVLALTTYVSTHKPAQSILAGLWIGLAVGSKITALLLIIPLLAAHVKASPRAGKPVPRFTLHNHHAFWLTVLAAAAVFALTNPYALLDPVPFVGDTVTQMRMAAGELDWPFTRQYARTLPFIYTITQQARWTLSLPLTLAVYTALIVCTWRALKTKQQVTVTALAWAWVALLTTGLQFVKFPRYSLPLTPTLFALAGGLLTGGLARQRPTSSRARWLYAGAAAVILLITGAYAAAFTAMYSTPHPWITASAWIYDTIPGGSRIIVEMWDDPLPLDIEINGEGFIREEVYQTTMLDLFAEPDSEAKLQQTLTALADADYVILSSNRLYGVIPRLPRRYPYSAAYYCALFAGDLGYTLEASFTRSPELFGIALVDDPVSRAGLEPPVGISSPDSITPGFADESLTVYDHPLVLVFKNNDSLTAGQMTHTILEMIPAP